MGQQIAVVAKPSSTPGVLRFEANRILTGSGHEVFRSEAEAKGPRPAAALARRLLSSGQVHAVHMYGNMITIDLNKGFGGEGLDEMVRSLHQYWMPGMELPVFDDVAPEAAAPAAGGGETAGAGPSEYERLVPANLIERSRAALAKWKATHGG